jgi:alkylated DNA repair protein (DNA oxidative demethylase)
MKTHALEVAGPLQLGLGEVNERRLSLGANAVLLRGFARRQAPDLIAAIVAIASVSPFRQMTTPGGLRMSVAMTNCGAAGWVTDRTGYRYDAIDPETGQSWPHLPAAFAALATDAAASAGFADFEPDVCLINRYAAGTRLSLHQDRDERDFTQPIVSVSLGLPAVFLWGGRKRSDRPTRVPVSHGDVVVWGGSDRLNFHGVRELAQGTHPLTGDYRYNLTFRKAR